MSDQVIAVEFMYQRSEYIRAIRSLYRQKLNLPMDLMVGCGLVWVSAISAYGRGWNVTNIVMGVVGITFLGMIGCGLFIAPILVYKSQPKLRDHYQLVFSEADIHFRTPAIDARLQWATYDSWQVTHEFYLLRYGKRDISVIPRRVFPDFAADEAFRALVTRKIGGPTRSPKSWLAWDRGIGDE